MLKLYSSLSCPFDPEAKLLSLFLTEVQSFLALNQASFKLALKNEGARQLLSTIVAGLCANQGGVAILNKWLSDPSHWLTADTKKTTININENTPALGVLGREEIKKTTLFSLADVFRPKNAIVDKQLSDSPLRIILNKLWFVGPNLEDISLSLNPLNALKINLQADARTARAWPQVAAYYLKITNALFADLDFCSKIKDAYSDGIDQKTSLLKTKFDADDIPLLAQFIFTLHSHQRKLNAGKKR